MNDTGASVIVICDGDKRNISVGKSIIECNVDMSKSPWYGIHQRAVYINCSIQHSLKLKKGNMDETM